MSKPAQTKFAEGEEKILAKYKKDPSVYSKIINIIQLCTSHDENDTEFFMSLYQKLDSPELGVKEICLYEIFVRGVPYDAADLVLPHFYYRLVSLLMEPSSTDLIKLYALQIYVEILPHDILGFMTLDIYTPAFLSSVSQFLNSSDELLKAATVDFFSEVCEAPFNLAGRLLDNTNILNHVEFVLTHKKYEQRSTRRLYLSLLSALTTIDHRSFSAHLNLWKWVLDFFVKAKKGTSFTLVTEIMQHLDISIGKEVLKGAEGVFYKKLQEMIASESADASEGGLAVLSTAISIDDYYAEKFISEGGLDTISNKLKNKSAIQESLMVLSALNRSREIYRESVINHSLFMDLSSMAHGKGFGRSIRLIILGTLAEFFIEGSERQFLRLMNKGLLDMLLLYSQDYRSILLLENIGKVIKRVLVMAKGGTKIAQQKLYELNTCQVFNKILGSQRAFSGFSRPAW